MWGLFMKSSDPSEYNFIRGLCAGDSCVSINGNSEIMIENHKGIIEVGCECIKFLTKKNRVAVCGKKLKMFYYNAEDIVINGCIESITFEGRNI